MREYTVEQSSLDFKWTFERMLPSLPGPGSPAFAELCKALHPYGITPTTVTVDAPSIRLADLNLGIGLLNNRVIVKISSVALELIVRELLVGDEEKLIPITEQLFAALKEIDADVVQGHASLRAYSHLKMAPGEYELLLREHTRLSEGTSAFAPYAIIYDVKPEPDSKAKELKVTIAKSLAYQDSLFLDITVDYIGPIAPSDLAQQWNVDTERVVEMLGLREQTDTQENKES